MTSKLTREERVQSLYDLKIGQVLNQSDIESIKMLARMALAAIDSEPVVWVMLEDLADKDIVSTPAYPDINDAMEMTHGELEPLYRHAQPAPVVPLPDVVSVLLNHLEDVLPDDAFNLIDVKAWNAVSMLTCPDACRATMLQASPVCTCPSGDGSLRWPCPVHPGNSPAIPDSARDALEKALAAMEFMGDTLNNLDAVCTEDVELVAPAFDAVRNVLAAAPQEEAK